MRWALVAILALAVPAVAEEAKKPAKAEAAKAEPAKAEKPATKCKTRVTGKGKDRKTTYVCEEEIVVQSGPNKPAVVIAPVDGRKVTGRPKLTDPLEGLSRRRTQ
jgi:hypothetical protein